jgi:hypothetical protein
VQKAAILTAVVSVLFGGTSTAQAHLVTRPKCDTLKCRAASQQKNLAHVTYVANNGKGKHVRWHQTWVTILKRELAETRAALRFKLSLREWIRRNDPCAYEIIDRETAGTWDVTIWNGQGSGAYGWPQALPASKMASAGSDWRTNEHTQYKWFKGYVSGRYGGSCAALAYHNANGYY